ncbi:hypothetical protein LIER_30062 [Lithospermum erythrorhizon]|uniref:Gag-pol polyprotein n=1 Tax=Lithospermum erythrorhizon TaxID=34254 RepID=A0AAV3RPK8_LITER
MSNEKLVRKTLRTLPKRFSHKVTAIEEAQNLTTMMVDERIGNLTTLEMSINEGKSSKKKGIALKAASEEVDDEDLVETMNMLAKNFDKSLKRFNKKPYIGCGFPLVIDKGNNSEEEEDITEEELLEDYKLLYTKWTELTIAYTKIEVERCKLKKENEMLTKIVMDRDEEIKNLNAQLKYLNKGIGFQKGKFNNPKGEMKFVPTGGNQQSTTFGATGGYTKRNNII